MYNGRDKIIILFLAYFSIDLFTSKSVSDQEYPFKSPSPNSYSHRFPDFPLLHSPLWKRSG
jgi:hypothetical protein